MSILISKIKFPQSKNALTNYPLANCPRCYKIPNMKIAPSTNPSYLQLNCSHCSLNKLISIEEYINNLKNPDCPLTKIHICEGEICSKQMQKNFAYSYCMKCSLWLCSKCIDEHNVTKPEHKEKDIFDYLEKKCNEHCNQENEYFCKECKIQFCNECMGKHIKHQYMKINTFIDNSNTDKIQESLTQAELLIKQNYRKAREYITLLNECINRIETAMFKNRNINQNIVDLLRILYSNSMFVDSNCQIYDNILNNYDLNNIKLELNEGDVKEVTDIIVGFFSTYYLKGKPKIEIINAKTVIQPFKPHSKWIGNLILLQDKRLASCSSDNRISIYNKETFDIEIDYAETKGIKSIAQIDNGLLLSVFNNIVSVYKIETQSLIKQHSFMCHTSRINKIISLSNNRFATCSQDTKICLWNGEAPFKEIKTLKGHSNAVKSIIQLKGKEKLISGSWDKTVRMWDIGNRFLCEKKLNGIGCGERNSIIEIPNNKLIIGEMGQTNIVNIITFQLEMKISISDNCFSSFLYDDLNKQVYCGSEVKGLYELKISNMSMGIPNLRLFNEEGGISAIEKIDDNIIAVGGTKGTLYLIKLC